MSTWLSNPKEPDDDFPQYFTTEDMEDLGLVGDVRGIWQAEKQRLMLQGR